MIRNGRSILLSNLPKVEEIPVATDDPLRVSRFLLSNLDAGYQESTKVVKHKVLDKDIKEGVSSNYYREKLKLENKPL